MVHLVDMLVEAGVMCQSEKRKHISKVAGQNYTTASNRFFIQKITIFSTIHNNGSELERGGGGNNGKPSDGS